MPYKRFSIRPATGAGNGYSGKTLKGEVPIQAPRDRNGTFEPQLIAKGQTRLARLDSQILAFYAKGMTTRDIADTLQELYGTEVSPALVAKVTDAVWDTVQAWQSRSLERVYPILQCVEAVNPTLAAVTRRAYLGRSHFAASPAQ